MSVIETLELKSPLTGVAHIFIGDSLMAQGLSGTSGAGNQQQPLDWYIWPGGKTQQGCNVLKDVLKKDRYKGASQIRIIFTFGHNDWMNYAHVPKILRNCSSLVKKHGARISFIAPLMPLR